MFSAIVVVVNNLPESQRSFHASIHTLLAGKPYMDLTNVAASLQKADFNLSPAEAGLNGGPDAAATPLMCIALPMLLVNYG
jgi:hypothetical protein